MNQPDLTAGSSKKFKLAEAQVERRGCNNAGALFLCSVYDISSRQSGIGYLMVHHQPGCEVEGVLIVSEINGRC